MSIEAMKQALEALEAAAFSFRNVDAITALRTAIEQAEMDRGPVVGTKTWFENGEVKTKKVYMADLYDEPPAAPVQEPVGRTDQQIVDQTEELAVWLLSWGFNRLPETDTPMRESTHPMAKRCWSAACHIQEMLTATDPENSVAELDVDDTPPAAPVQERVAITDAMAFAFHRALSDGAIGESDVEEIKAGLAAAFAHITALRTAIEQAEKQEPVGFDAWFDAEFQAVNGYVSSGDPVFYDSMLRCKAWALKAWKKATPPAAPVQEPVEGYPSDWAKVTLMVSPSGEMHAIGGDRVADAGDTPYIGLERIKQALAAQPAPVQEPFDTHSLPGKSFDTHSRTPQRQWVGLTDEEFLESLLRNGSQEIVGVTTYVTSKRTIGLLHSAKLIRDFVDAKLRQKNGGQA